MYCTACECVYDGWSGKCPVCKQPLQEGQPPELKLPAKVIEYTQLLDLVKSNGGSLQIQLSAREVMRKSSTRFPYTGFGYAWTQILAGTVDGISIELTASQVEKDRQRSFFYRGHGFAWQQEMQGVLGGNPVTLRASQVKRDRSWSFPYTGYGYAWTEEMVGECGDQIQALLTAKDVIRKHKRRFPYFGYGYAWVEEYQLSLELSDRIATRN